MAKDRTQALRRMIGDDPDWVIGQTALFIAVVLASVFEFILAGRRVDSVDRRWFGAVGAVMLVVAGVVALRAQRDLSESFTMSPTPLQDATFVDRGIYARVRHPMYASVLLALGGVVILLGSLAGALGLVLTAIYLVVKIRYEEDKLLERYPTYRDYQRRVPTRLVPRIW